MDTIYTFSAVNKGFSKNAKNGRGTEEATGCHAASGLNEVKAESLVNSVWRLPGRKAVLAGCSDGLVLLWSEASGQVLLRLEGHEQLVSR